MRKGHISSQFNDCRRVFSAGKYDIQDQLPPRATKVGLAGLGDPLGLLVLLTLWITDLAVRISFQETINTEELPPYVSISVQLKCLPSPRMTFAKRLDREMKFDDCQNPQS